MLTLAAVAGLCAGLLGLLVGRRVGCLASRFDAQQRWAQPATAVIFALVAVWFVGTQPLHGSSAGLVVSWLLALAALLVFAASSVALTMIDIAEHRLPDVVVLPSLGAVSVLLTASAVCAGDFARIGQIWGAGAVLLAFYGLLALLSPGGIGGGDVKLAALIGVVLGWVGWGALVIGVVGAGVLSAVWALVLIARRGRKASIPFGPFMLAGAWTSIVCGEATARWALGSLLSF